MKNKKNTFEIFFYFYFLVHNPMCVNRCGKLDYQLRKCIVRKRIAFN